VACCATMRCVRSLLELIRIITSELPIINHYRARIISTYRRSATCRACLVIYMTSCH